MTSLIDQPTSLEGNPCPFLRALVTAGAIVNTHDPLPHVTVVATKAFPPPRPLPLSIAVYLIALIGNGFAPLQLLRNLLEGLRAGALRGGPLDKRGAGSRILDRYGAIDRAQLDRLETFASDYRNIETGKLERGLGMAQLTAMMEANFARAKPNRRRVDRLLMNGEWPVLLRLMGKPSDAGSYLNVAEVRQLFAERTLPERVLDRLETAPR